MRPIVRLFYTMPRRPRIITEVPFDPRDGYPSGRDIYYECLQCRCLLPSAPKDSGSCICNNLAIDVDYFRFAVKDENKLRIVRLQEHVAVPMPFADDAADNPTDTIQGTIADIDAAVDRVLSFEHGTFVAAIPDQSDLFVQFVCADGRARFVFPLLTAQQRTHEGAIRAAARGLGVSLEREADDLTIEVECTAPVVSRLVAELLQRVYNVTVSTPLTIQSF